MPTSILIVDDEPSNLAVLKQILGSYYTLFFARTGAECLVAAKKHLPALILLDIQMPGMDGYTACRTLKSDSLTQNIPVIFVSALGDVGNEAAGFACGGVDYLIKPVSPALVLARITTHLSLVSVSRLEIYIKQLEIERAKTARLSRILAFLSDTNSMIIRTKEPQALFEEACGIAVDQGGFGVAWIGMQEPENRTLTLAASSGIRADQKANLLRNPSDTRSPIIDIPFKVLATGSIAYCNDLRKTEDTGAHQQDLLNMGFFYVVGLPLFTAEIVTGVLMLHAREADYFDEKELKLLSELAGDISYALQAIEYEKKANFLSYFDALTALPNTTLFFDRLSSLVQTAHRDDSAVFVIAINLSQFKQINDKYGRHVGDQVLRAVSKRLSDGFARNYCVARLGSDNFVVAGGQTSGEKAAVLAEKIIALLGVVYVIDRQPLSISVHLGIAMYPNDACDGESLIRNAEAALKQTKSRKTGFTFYSREINARIVDKVELERLLKIAIREEQFILHYQPKVDLRSGQIVAAEALIRWQHPQRGVVPPMEFIPLAEENGMILAIGEWVIRAVCAQQAAWLSDGIAIVPVALNLSALQFTESRLQDIVCTALEKNQLAAQWIELELTETLVMENPEATQVAMRAFRDMGLRLSLDDFGTGYSSLAYLKRFPFNAVKIDRSFVTDITHNIEDAAIATAIIAMSHSLNMRVIAEGVENEAQLAFLRSKNCDEMQGFLFSRPIPAQDFAAMLLAGKRIIFKENIKSMG